MPKSLILIFPWCLATRRKRKLFLSKYVRIQVLFNLTLLMLLVTPVRAQIPRPYAYGGLSLNGGGYSPAGGIIGVGLDIDTEHSCAIAEIWTGNAHKRDSGTGLEVGGKARAFYLTGRGWYFGGGAQWSKLVTVDYSKQGWRPTFGAGKDIIREDFSARAQVMYVLPGTDRLNAVQGPEINIWIPSPATQAHLMYRQSLGIYEFHQTSVPGNSGTQDRSGATFVEFTLMYRF
jgi:hypothetical protein